MVDIVERLLAQCVDWDGSEMPDGAETLTVVDCATMREAARKITDLRTRLEDRVIASREAKVLIDEINLRAEYREFFGIDETLRGKLRTIHATLTRKGGSP